MPSRRTWWVYLVTIIVLGTWIVQQRTLSSSAVVVEHFKKKKKGKKKYALDKENPEFEIDMDEIINKVEESREEAEEPPDDEGDPEDDEGDAVSDGGPANDLFGAGEPADGPGSGGGGGGGDSSWAPPARSDKAPSNEPSNRETMEQQRKEIAAEPNWLIGDLLHFKLVVPYVSKRLICVIPNEPKHLYMIALNHSTSNQKARLVGASSVDVIIQESLPSEIAEIEIHDPKTPYDEGLEEFNYIIFYDKPTGHPFWKWLNKSYWPIEFLDYLNSPKSLEAKGALLTQFPYFHIRTVDVKPFVPGKPLKRQHLNVLSVDTCAYSNKPFMNEFYKVYDRYHGSREHQTFYELFFPYFSEILANRIGVVPSTRLKEEFVNAIAATGQRALIKISEPVPTLATASYVRDVFKELIVERKHLENGARIKVGDRVLLENQVHRSLDGEFYVSEIRFGKVLLQSRWLVKDLKGFKMLDASRAVANGIDARLLSSRIQPNDPVYLKEIDRGAMFLASNSQQSRTKQYFFRITDDVVTRDRLYRCVTRPNVLVKQSCESKYDEFGARKADGVADVWDRPCLYDEECPFFGKGKWSKFRGGCGDGGYCEMPVGYTNVGYRFYVEDKVAKKMLGTKAEEIRFGGDVFEAEV